MNSHKISSQVASTDALVQLEGPGLKILGDYQGSLHYKMTQQQKEEQYKTRGQLLGINLMQPKPLKTKIKFGETQLTQYTKMIGLGKGTYGEVNKCLHNPTNEVVAVKSFFFEVSATIIASDSFTSECFQRNKLQHHARNLSAQTTQRLPQLCLASGRARGERRSEEQDPLRVRVLRRNSILKAIRENCSVAIAGNKKHHGSAAGCCGYSSRQDDVAQRHQA